MDFENDKMKKNKERPTRIHKIMNIEKILKNTSKFSFISYFKDKKCKTIGRTINEIKNVKESK